MPQQGIPLSIYQDQPVEAIVGREPNWLIRSGISLLAVILLMLLILSSVIKYPNTLQSQIKITPNIPPAQLTSKISGRVQDIYVQDGEIVSIGQALLLIENNVDQQELSYLEDVLEKYNQLSSFVTGDELIHLKLDSLSNLGELQPEFEAWHQQINRLRLILASKEKKEQIKQLIRQAEEAEILNENLVRKKTNWEKLIDNQKVAIDNQELLAKEGVVSDASILPLRNEYLVQQVSLDDLAIEIARNNSNQKDYLQQVGLIKAQTEDLEQELIYDIGLAAANLKNAIISWRHNYVITSPVDGVLSMAKFLGQNQQVISGQTLIYVAVGTSKMRGELIIPHRGAGKLKIGQEVDVELESFPANEYGKLVGEVFSISDVPTENGYLVHVDFPDAFVSTTGYKIPLTPEQVGLARVITEKRSVIERLFGNITYIVKSNQ